MYGNEKSLDMILFSGFFLPLHPIRKCSAVLYLSLFQVICGCSFYCSSVDLAVHLPQPPDHWQAAFPEINFRIIYPNPESCGFREQLVDGSENLILEIPKDSNIPILGYPILPGETAALPPAGAVYPMDCAPANTHIRLTWEEGVLAEILYRLDRGGMDCAAINVIRLRQQIHERCPGDPWSLDLDRICLELASGKFHLTDIRPATSRDLLIAPGPGQWFLESPFHRPVAAGADGSLHLEAVTLGGHYLFDNPATTCFFLYISEDSELLLPR